jgi:hypothetical protein
LPYSSLKDLDPLVLLLVPSAQRARTPVAAISDSAVIAMLTQARF